MKFSKSVREIVGYVYQSGDINTEYFTANRAQQGTDAHQVVQKSYKKSECEISLAHSMTIDEHEISMSGRADLVLDHGSEFIVGEIKSTTRKLDSIIPGDRPNHYAQAKFYAYFLMLKNPNLESITVRLIYCDLDGENTREFDEVYSLEELELFVTKTLEIYIQWAITLMESQSEKFKTARELEFPFGEFRPFQRELSGAVYTCIKEDKNLLLRAPTGIGKTMATIYPSLKALQSPDQKIFYFTAKTVGRTVAEKAFQKCSAAGLHAKVTTITAKERICFMAETRCDPTYCPYAKGHFDRERDAVKDLFSSESLYNREVIEKLARKHQVCPFEFSLTMASVSDAVIGDYNYLFDPRAYLRRFFEEPDNHIVLIDEAHNLYDRACEMFSAEIKLSRISYFREVFTGLKGPLNKHLKDLEELIWAQCSELKSSRTTIDFQLDLDEILVHKVDRVCDALEKYLRRNHDSNDRSNLVNFYFELLHFVRISAYYTESFRMCFSTGDDAMVQIVCLNPGEHLADRLQKVKAGILFSATLHPLDYFQSVLLGDQDAEQLFIPSPFERERLDFTVNHGISTKYNAREHTAPLLCEKIFSMTSRATGNYFVFFPSYAYMEQIFSEYSEFVRDKQEVIMQERRMDEADRDEFLALFENNPQKTLVAFVVLGGIFGEGIDLTGDALIGAVIIGVGFPQINPLTKERQLYFEETFGDGNYYAYVVPGFNKVMQAVGRVIRTEADEGSVLLIDDRYMNEEYLQLFPHEWKHAKFIR